MNIRNAFAVYMRTSACTLVILLFANVGWTMDVTLDPSMQAGAQIGTEVNLYASVVNVSPGTIWRYSGGGYVIVQQALLDTTGALFPQLMRERVLGLQGEYMFAEDGQGSAHLRLFLPLPMQGLEQTSA